MNRATDMFWNAGIASDLRCSGLLLGNTAPSIVKTFGDAADASWIPNEYTIVTAAIAGLTGGCADHVGRKNVLIGGILVAFVGSIVIAAAQTMAAVLVGAAMQAGLFVSDLIKTLPGGWHRTMTDTAPDQPRQPLLGPS